MTHNNPLLLLDNSSMMNVIGDGEYVSHNMGLEETKAVLETFDADDIRICFSNSDIVNIIFPWLGIENRDFKHKEPKRMHRGQEAIVFKLHVTPSETQPIVTLGEGEGAFEAKKIQNIYVYCQYLTRVK